MARALLINVADLDAFTNIGVNYDDKDLRNAVLKAQEQNLQGIIGKNLLQRFETDIADSNIIPTDYSNLLRDYIAPYLIQASYLNVLDNKYVSIKSNGLGQRNSSPNYTTLSPEIYHEKQRMIEQDLDFHGNKLAEYLNNNYNLFAELSETALPSDRASLTRQFNGSPLVFDRSKRTWDKYNY